MILFLQIPDKLQHFVFSLGKLHFTSYQPISWSLNWYLPTHVIVNKMDDSDTEDTSW